jgi:hypothetical protein
MNKDFAERNSPKKRKPATRKPAKGRTPTKNKITFHAPSFSSGAIVGAVVVLVAAYAPEIIGTSTAAKNAVVETQETPKIRFEFPDLLKNNEVAANPETYSAPQASTKAEKKFLEFKRLHFVAKTMPMS